MYKNLLRPVVITVAVVLFGIEFDYLSNRQTHRVPTSGRTIDKVQIENCYAAPVHSGDVPFDYDFNQAVASACGSCLRAHYLRIAAIVLVSLGLLVATFSRPANKKPT
jgi:hypothetical protein